MNPYAGPAKDYCILFRDTEVPALTDSDYGKRCLQDDLLLADKASYVWGYVGELNDGQVSMIQKRLDGVYEERFKEEFEFSHTDIPSSYGFEITIVVRWKLALKVLAEVSPDLEFISRNVPLHRFWFFPKIDVESMRLKQALSSLPDGKKPSIRWNMYKVEFPKNHRSFARLLPLETLMNGLERVGYARENLLRHTAAIWIIDTALSASVPRRNLSPVKIKHSQLNTKFPRALPESPKVDGATAFLKGVNNDTLYIPVLSDRQLEVLETSVTIANNIRTAFNCGYRNIENKYEAVRFNNEAMRLNNEAERIQNERMRIRDEELRLQNEAEQVRNEAMRINAGKFSRYPHLTQTVNSQGASPVIPVGKFTEQVEEPMVAPGGTPPMILAARIKKTKQTADKTTFRKTLEEDLESMANMTDKVEVVNKEAIKTSLDDDSISKLAQAITKDRKKDTADGIQDGLLQAEALSQPSRQAKIREMQEDMLSQQGHKPVDIARLHNPNAKDSVIRKAAQKISNDQNRRKKKKSK